MKFKFLLILLAIAGSLYVLAVYQSSHRIHEGVLAPEFVLPSESGEKIRLGQYLGKTVLLNFGRRGAPPVLPKCRHSTISINDLAMTNLLF